MAAAAARSALAQTLAPLEVLVVIDGPESLPAGTQGTAEILAEIADSRLLVIPLRASGGGGEARNLGVRAARAAYVAFLDDDDLWLPTKLAVQMEAAALLPPGVVPVLSCPVIARSPLWEEQWPRERPGQHQPISEYLFCRRGWGSGLRYGSALLQTSTLVAPRALWLRCPFASGLARHQDWDWLLRAAREPDVSVQLVGSAPLAIFHVEGSRSSVSRMRDWHFSLTWALERRNLFTPRALAAFIATECAAQAQTAGWSERLLLLRALLSTGPQALQALPHAAVFLLTSQGTRRALRDLLRPARAAIRAT